MPDVEDARRSTVLHDFDKVSLHSSINLSLEENRKPMATVAVHLGLKMADTLSFTAKVDIVDF